MKKIFLVILAIVVILIAIFPPNKISKGGGGLHDIREQICHGLYIQTYDQTPVDGGKGGYCFGRVERVYIDSLSEKELKILDNAPIDTTTKFEDAVFPDGRNIKEWKEQNDPDWKPGFN